MIGFVAGKWAMNGAQLAWRDRDRALAILCADVYTFFATIPLWVGFDLLRPGSSFATSASWRIFAQLADEDVWGWCFLALGLLAWAGMFVRRRDAKLLILSILALCYGATGVLFLVGTSLSTGSGTYALIAWLVFRFILVSLSGTLSLVTSEIGAFPARADTSAR